MFNTQYNLTIVDEAKNKQRTRIEGTFFLVNAIIHDHITTWNFRSRQLGKVQLPSSQWRERKERPEDGNFHRRPASIYVRGWFSFLGLGFIDIVYDNVHPPDPLKLTQELLDHNVECFTSTGLLIHADMPLFKEASVKQSLVGAIETKGKIVSAKLWKKYVVYKAW